MDALLAMQLESLMLFSIVVAVFLLRFVLVQLAISLHRTCLYEQQMDDIISLSAQRLHPDTYRLDREPTVISPAQPAFSHFPTDYSVA